MRFKVYVYGSVENNLYSQQSLTHLLSFCRNDPTIQLLPGEWLSAPSVRCEKKEDADAIKELLEEEGFKVNVQV